MPIMAYASNSYAVNNSIQDFYQKINHGYITIEKSLDDEGNLVIANIYPSE